MAAEFANKRITVAGLGRFGGSIAAARWLCERGAKVLVTDQEKEEKLRESMKQLADLPIEWRLGEHRIEDFTHADLVVASPAIPPTNAFLAAARDARVPVTTEMKLFIERLPRNIKTLAVTGTKGKSTTTTLLGMMLQKRYPVYVGGNIGKSLLFDLQRISSNDLVLLELSSFMLEYLKPLRWSPHGAIYTFISQDHLEWHAGLNGYLGAKAVLAESQALEDFVVFNPVNTPAAELASRSAGKKIPYSQKHFELRLPGKHNQLNAQAAFAAAEQMGIGFEEAQSSVRDFAGLPHRLQLVHESGGVRYFNDSIATIPEAAIAALESFAPKTVIQIVGGYDKHLERSDLIRKLDARAKAALCIGATGPALAAEMAAIRNADSPAVHDCGDLATAMIVARRLARPADVVLLSTGFASYDQFGNFEERGKKFVDLSGAA